MHVSPATAWFELAATPEISHAASETRLRYLYTTLLKRGICSPVGHASSAVKHSVEHSRDLETLVRTVDDALFACTLFAARNRSEQVLGMLSPSAPMHKRECKALREQLAAQSEGKHMSKGYMCGPAPKPQISVFLSPPA